MRSGRCPAPAEARTAAPSCCASAVTSVALMPISALHTTQPPLRVYYQLCEQLKDCHKYIGK